MSESESNFPILPSQRGKQKEASRTPEPVFRPDAIYFDTNPLLGAGWPTPSAQLLQILDQADKVGFPLCLPEVVKQELEGHWIREMREQWSNANSGIDRLNKQSRSIAKFARLSPLPSHDDLRKSVRELVSEFTRRFRLVPLTERPLSEFLQLAIYRGATFDDGGRGFQDAVILCSVLDEMRTTKLAAAVLVTNDKAFQNSGVTELARAVGVKLKIVTDLDELEKLLKSNFNAFVREYFAEERKQLMQALDARLEELQDYLVKNLTVAPRDLGVWGVKRIESLDVLGIENAHSTREVKENPECPDKFRVSADVKVRLSLDTERPPPPEPEQRLKVGGVAPQPTETTAHFDFFSLRTNSCEVVAVVEATAKKTGDAYSDIRFTSARLKGKDAYRDFIQSLWRV